MKCFCIADADTARGFSLAGVSGQAVASPAEAAEALAWAAKRRDVALILLTETVAAGLEQQLEQIRFQREAPLIVEIPGPGTPLSGRKSLVQVVQESVGIRVEGEGNT